MYLTPDLLYQTIYIICLGLFMLQRLLSKKQPHTLSGLLPKISQYSVVVTMLSSALFLMPSAHAASCKIPKSYYKNVSCTASSSYFLAIKDFGAPVALIDKKGNKSLICHVIKKSMPINYRAVCCLYCVTVASVISICRAAKSCLPCTIY